MGYYNELKDVRKELKKILSKNKIKASVRGGQGTSLFWTHISHPKGQEKWTENQLKVLKEDLGFSVGNPFNDISSPMEQLQAKVRGYRYKDFKKSKDYLNLKKDFSQCALKEADEGTCVLGAGTIVKKNGTPIDFWRQHGQGEHRDIVAQRIMENRAKKLGLTFEHEGGVMD
jgi:hypothetical protein